MRESIMKALYEHRVQYDTNTILKNYTGSDSILLDFKKKLDMGYNLTEKQMALAVNKLKNEFYNSSIYNQILSYKDKSGKYLYRNKIISKGKETYNNIVRTSKRNFFTSDETGQLKIDKPSDSWINENINSLNTFIDLTKDSLPKKFLFPNRDTYVTTHKEAQLLLNQLQKKDFWGFMEKQGDEYVWSILNKVDTNYINWAKMISKRDLKGDLGSGSVESKIDRYFEQQKIEDIYRKEMEDLDLDTKRKIWAYATTLSIAEFDLIESFITHSHKSPNTTAIDQLDNIMDRLKNTTSLGDQAEDDFIMWLQTHNVRPKDIIRFNTYGNLVDVTFQTDLLLNHNGQWIPIQVKNKETKISKLLNYNIGGIIIYPAPTKFNCGSWIFFNGESLAKSFDEVYFNLSC